MEKPGWSGLAGGREAKKSRRRRREISRAEEKRLPPPFLDLPQNTSLLPGGQCLQPCDGGAVQLGSCARYDARRPDG